MENSERVTSAGVEIMEMRRARITTEERIRRFESMYPGVAIEPVLEISCGAPVGNEVW